MIYLGYAISAFVSSMYSIKYWNRFDLTLNEKLKVILKSINLSLCYSSFADSGNIKHYIKAGLAGFFSSAYDIVTDWKSFEQIYKKRYFEIILHNVKSIEIQQILLNMYERDKEGVLDIDGLERGADSLKLILLFMDNIEQFQMKHNLKEFGYCLQIMDDILDFEEDRLNEDLNCLLSDNWEQYLIRFKVFFEMNKNIFNSSPIMKYVINKSRKKISYIKEINNIHIVNEVSKCS